MYDPVFARNSRVRKYDHSSLDPAADTVGRRTFSTLAAARAALAGEAVCMPVEWTDSSMAASSSLMFSVSHVHSGNGHCYFGIVVLCVPGRSFVFFVVLVVVIMPTPRGAVRMGETRWRWR